MTATHQRSRNPGPIDSTALPNPLSISSMVAWYRAHTLALADGDSVTTWSDDSGNGLTLTGSTKKPIFKTNQINGYPALRFENKVMLLAAARSQNPCSWFMVCNFITNINHAMLLYATGNNFMWLQYGSTWYCANSYSATVAQDNGNYHLWCGTISSTTAHRYRSGVDQGAQTVAGNFEWAGIGHASYLTSVDIAEFIVYSKLLSDTERLGIETYIKAKYGTF